MDDHPPPTCTLTARWLFPVSTPPLSRGTLTVGGRHILAVEPEGCRTADLDLGNVAILPGLVNAHTHLDLSGLRGRCPPGNDFTGWLRAVIRHRRGVSAEQVRDEVRRGLAESLAAGTTLLADISSQGLSRDVLADSPARSVVFYELLGLPAERGRQAWEAAASWLHSGWPSRPPADSEALCRPGLSPHAPYSVGRSLFRTAAEQALPTAVHLAESPAELDLLREHRGSLVPFLAELGVWEPQELVGSIAEVLQTFAAVPSFLIVHGNYLDPKGPLPPGATLVYCPRTHAAFGHPPHPFRALLDRGVRVALGTDSLASSPDLSVLAEARFLHARYPDVRGSTLLRMATLSGAEGLGWEEETGSLAVGKSADLVVVPLPAEEAADPHTLVLACSLPPRAVMCRGEWVADVLKSGH